MYDRLLASLSKKIDESRDEVKQLIKQASIRAVGPIPGVKTGDIPLHPRRDDYPEVNYWDQETWSLLRSKGNNKDSKNSGDPILPILSLFMEDEFGMRVSKGTIKAVYNDVTSFWEDMLTTRVLPKIFSKTGLNTKEAFRIRMEGKYPWLRLCDGHWKVNHLWINYFTSWRTSRFVDGIPTLPPINPRLILATTRTYP